MGVSITVRPVEVSVYLRKPALPYILVVRSYRLGIEVEKIKHIRQMQVGNDRVEIPYL